LQHCDGLDDLGSELLSNLPVSFRAQRVPVEHLRRTHQYHAFLPEHLRHPFDQLGGIDGFQNIFFATERNGLGDSLPVIPPRGNDSGEISPGLVRPQSLEQIQPARPRHHDVSDHTLNVGLGT
jgi:hypothetical protein